MIVISLVSVISENIAGLYAARFNYNNGSDGVLLLVLTQTFYSSIAYQYAVYWDVLQDANTNTNYNKGSDGVLLLVLPPNLLLK